MNKLLAINTFLVCCILFFCCKKEDVSPSVPLPEYVPVHSPCDTSTGIATANKLTAAWKAGVVCRRTSASGGNFWAIELTTCSSNDGSTREKVYFGGIPDANPAQLYQIHKTQNSIPTGSVISGYSTFASDGDVLEDFYYTDSLSTKNYLKIEEWDNVNKRVSGSFHVSFGIKEPRRNIQSPKKVTFSSGKFWVKLPE